MNYKIRESINTAKDIIVSIMDSDEIMLTESCEIMGKATILKYTFSECIAYRTENASCMLKNLLFNTRNSLPIRIRIALAAVLETCSFVPNENALIPVYFEKTIDIVPVYKWFDKNWGRFDVNIHFTEDSIMDENEYEKPRTISLMTGEWKEACFNRNIQNRIL